MIQVHKQMKLLINSWMKNRSKPVIMHLDLEIMLTLLNSCCTCFSGTSCSMDTSMTKFYHFSILQHPVPLEKKFKGNSISLHFLSSWKVLGSLQVLYKQVFPKSGPPPHLNKQNKHHLRPPSPLKCLYDTWMAIRSNTRNILYQIQAS